MKKPNGYSKSAKLKVRDQRETWRRAQKPVRWWQLKKKEPKIVQASFDERLQEAMKKWKKMSEWNWIQVTPWEVIAWCDKCGDDSGPRILQEEKRYK